MSKSKNSNEEFYTIINNLVYENYKVVGKFMKIAGRKRFSVIVQRVSKTDSINSGLLIVKGCYEEMIDLLDEDDTLELKNL